MFTKRPVTKLILEYLNEFGRFTSQDEIIEAIADRTSRPRSQVSLLAMQGVYRLRRAGEVIMYKAGVGSNAIYGLSEWADRDGKPREEFQPAES